MAAPMIRRFFSKQIVRYATVYKSRFNSGNHVTPCLSPRVKTTGIVFGPSLAFLGFFTKKEEEEPVLSEHDQVRAILSKGVVAKETNNIQEASEAFHEALMLSTDFLKQEKITKEEHMNHRVFIYDLIANMALDNGDFKAAEEVFKETMKLALALGMSETDNAMMEMSLKLAGIYLFTGRIEIGLIGLNHVITEQNKKIEEMSGNSETIQEKKPKDTNGNSNTAGAVDFVKAKEDEDNTRVLLGQAYQKFGYYYLMQRDFKKAEEMTQKALDISKYVMGETDDNTLALVNDMASCMIMQEEYEKAELMLIDAINKSRKAKSIMQAALLSNLGALYIRVKKYSDAKRACKRGLRVAEYGRDEYLMEPCKRCLEKLEEIEELSKQKNEKTENKADDDNDDDVLQ